jgi:acyl-coenzyme A synthetase/AMP-(fatty) acid ligase
MFSCVPTVFRLLLEAVAVDARFPDVRVVRLSGDRIRIADVALYKKHFSDTCLLRVMLAASECQGITQLWIDKTCEIKSDVVPVGFPLDGMEVFAVDENMNRLGQMERGEIAVKSRYLATGYWRNPRLTAERFLDAGVATEGRVYLTRDRGYFDEDGCLVHVGRKDARAKVYGKVVSLTDVEDALLTVPGVREAAVVAVSGDQETKLVAFIVDEGTVVDQIALRTKLLARLSPQDVPKTYVRLHAMPLTKNAKVDSLRLQALAEGKAFASNGGSAPRSD